MSKQLNLVALMGCLCLCLAPIGARGAGEAGQAVGRSDGQAVGRSGGGMGEARDKLNVLRPRDQVWVKVYQEEDLESKTTVDKNGFITLPLIGQVPVGQKTPEEASALIRELYSKDYLVNPQVNLMVVERAKVRFTVMGQVQRPGSLEILDGEPLNLLQAIAMAGGFTRLAAPNKVTLQRMQDGKPVVILVNAEQMSKDKRAKPMEVLPDDIITVGERVF